MIQYDKSNHPSLLFKHSNLHDHIYDLIEFGIADEKRRKEVVKVQIIKNLHKNLKKKLQYLYDENNIKQLSATLIS